MRLLLDTHAFLWWLKGSAQLTLAARGAITEASETPFVSAASAWEITTKHRIGKLADYAVIAADVNKTILERGFEPLPISVAHAQRAGALIGEHGDPFDRMLAAQTLLEGLTLISKDAEFDAFGVRRLW